MLDIALYGLIVLVFIQLLSFALGTGALAYLCYRMDRILGKLKRSEKSCQ